MVYGATMNDVQGACEMFRTLSTLMKGAQARTEDRVRDAYAIELIDQKIREAELAVRAAKGTLASLIQRRRAEQRLVDGIETRRSDLETRARAALAAGREELATEAAETIAGLENELRLRRETLDRLDAKIVRLTRSVEAGQRRMIELRQGAVQARAVKREAEIQSRLSASLSGQTAAEEAKELIARVLGQDDPFEHSEILAEIDEGLGNEGLADRMAAAGFGKATRTNAADVLARLKSTN
jgi:phage shock protein A